MNNKRKAVAALLVVSLMGSTCSCSAKFESSVADQADKLGKYIQDRDYKKIEKLSSGKEKDLESILAMDAGDSMNDNEAREIIASTLTYEVDEDSFEGDFFGREGSIDVTFTYVDYEKAIKDIAIFEDIDAFEEAIEECDDVVEQTITFEFEKDGGDTVCTNTGDIADLFPYADEEFNFALSRDSYTGAVTFQNLNNGSGYIDAYTITCQLAIEGDGQDLTWNYYWVVECNDVNLYTSDVMESDTDTFLTAFYSEDDILPDGNYVFTFYTEDDLMIGTGSVLVTHTEVTPTPTPTPAPSSGGSSVGPYFVSPVSGIIELPDTEITIDLPTGYICLNEDSSVLSSYFGSNADFMYNLVFFAANPIDAGGCFCVRMNYSSVDDPNAMSALQQAADAYTPDDVTVERSTSDYQIGDRTYTIETLVLANDSETAYCNFVLLGDDDSCYLLYFYSSSPDIIDEFMGGITVG